MCVIGTEIERNCRIDRVLKLKREPFPWLTLTIIVARDRDSNPVVVILRKYIEVADGRGH